VALFAEAVQARARPRENDAYSTPGILVRKIAESTAFGLHRWMRHVVDLADKGKCRQYRKKLHFNAAYIQGSQSLSRRARCGARR
jgi:hypothetical protein